MSTPIKPEPEIQEWLTSYLAALLDMPADEIHVDETVASYGVDSSSAVGLVCDLEKWLDRKLEPELVYSYPTIESLSRYLVAEG